MTKRFNQTSDTEKIYKAFRENPEEFKSSYLYNHYKRGLVGIIKPTASEKNALAAWKAGRDSSICETGE